MVKGISMLRWVALAGAMIAGQGLAQQSPPPPALGSTATVQQLFDAATALDESGTPLERLVAWERFEHGVRGNKRSVALARLRKSRALLVLGRRDEAAAQVRLGLADLPTSDPSLRADRVMGLLTLGAIAQGALDYPAAIDHYQAAYRLMDAPGERLTALFGLIKTQTFVDPAAAERSVAEAEQIAKIVPVAPEMMAELRRLDAERLLNVGATRTAQEKAMEAVKLNGGLTLQTRPNEVPARSDVAIAALLNGHKEKAREYLAMTGAGRLPQGVFASGLNVLPPDCGGEDNLKPGDMAVVQFSIADDGTVVDSEPVYAAGGGRVAIEFARAVRRWYWNPDDLHQMAAFYRSNIRVEMRCSTGFERPSIFTYVNTALGRWLHDKGVEPPPFQNGVGAAVLAGLREQLRVVEVGSGPGSLRLVPILMQIVQSETAPREERAAAATRADTILGANGARGLPRLAARLQAMLNVGAETDAPTVTAEVNKALADPSYAGDAESQVALRLIAAGVWRGKPMRARPWLESAANEAGLASNSPLRAAAWVQLASLEQVEGKGDAARAAFAKSGLDPSQCALIDQPPQMLGYGSGGTFPMEAAQWGFEGWTRVQFNVDKDGNVHDQRVVVAYPAFVFSEAGRKMAAGARYSKSFRPDGSLGCGGDIQNFRFTIGR